MAPGQHLYPASRGSAAGGVTVSPTPAHSCAGRDRSHQPGMLPPPRPAPLSAPSTLHIVLRVPFEENKFSFSNTDEGIQDLQKVFRKGKGSTVRTSRKMVPPFISDLTIFTIALPGVHLFTDNKLSCHITKATFGSVCDPQSTNVLKLAAQTKFPVKSPPFHPKTHSLVRSKMFNLSCLSVNPGELHLERIQPVFQGHTAQLIHFLVSAVKPTCQ